MSGDGLLPAESMALTVALAQVQRGEQPTLAVATVCVLALARLIDRTEDGAVVNDNELPGMWESTDLHGGWADSEGDQ